MSLTRGVRIRDEAETLEVAEPTAPADVFCARCTVAERREVRHAPPECEAQVHHSRVDPFLMSTGGADEDYPEEHYYVGDNHTWVTTADLPPRPSVEPGPPEPPAPPPNRWGPEAECAHSCAGAGRWAGACGASGTSRSGRRREADPRACPGTRTPLPLTRGAM